MMKYTSCLGLMLIFVVATLSGMEASQEVETAGASMSWKEKNKHRYRIKGKFAKKSPKDINKARLAVAKKKACEEKEIKKKERQAARPTLIVYDDVRHEASSVPVTKGLCMRGCLTEIDDAQDYFCVCGAMNGIMNASLQAPIDALDSDEEMPDA